MKKNDEALNLIEPSSEQRILRRIPRLDPLFTARVLINNIEYTGVIIDLDPLGLSIEFRSSVDIEVFKNDLPLSNLSLMYGKLELAKIKVARVVYLSKDFRRVGIDLRVNGEPGKRGHERFRINEHLAPVLICNDILSIGEKYVFKVNNLSIGGAQLSTSASNKNIIPELEINAAQIFLPGFGLYDCSGKISNIRFESGRLICGINWGAMSSDFKSAVQQFIFMGADNSERENLISDIKSAKISTRTLSKAVRVQKVSNNEQYEEMLKLRFDAYKAASKVPDGWTYKNFADEYDNHSIQYVVTVNQYVVGTFRLTYSESIDQTFPFEEKEPFTERIGFGRTEVFEVNKLAIMPDLQRSDLVIVIFRKVAEEGVKNNKNLLIFSTKALRKMYFRLGAAQVSGEYPHPTIKDESLALLVLPVQVYLTGKGMAGTSWQLISKPIIEHLNRFGIKTVSLFNPKQKIKYFFESIFLVLTGRKKKK